MFYRLEADTALAIALSNSLRDEELQKKRESINDFSFPPGLHSNRAAEGGYGMSQTEDNSVKDAFSILMSQPTPAEKGKKRRKKK